MSTRRRQGAVREDAGPGTHHSAKEPRSDHAGDAGRRARPPAAKASLPGRPRAGGFLPRQEVAQ